MKKSWIALSALLVLLVPETGRASPQMQGQISPDVICDGLVCGGSGGNSASPFLYRVVPDGLSISFVEIGVVDGDLSHYGNFAMPANWTVSMVTSARTHDPNPTAHGQTSGSSGTSPYVLRFAKPTGGSSLLNTFEVGFEYLLGHPGFHDVNWKLNSNRQSNWSLAVGSGKGPVHSPTRLNVLMIVLDDVGLDKLSVFDELFDQLDGTPNSPTAGTRTPNLDDLASDGIRFANYYTNPVCSTTRASLMTGRFSFRTGIGLIMETSCADPYPDTIYCANLLADELFLPKLLRNGMASGYAYSTGAFGKYHMSFWTPEADLPPVAGFESHAVDNGFQRFYGTMSNVGYDSSDHYTWRKVEHDVNGAPQILDGTDWSATVVREDAVAWINAQTEPFFAYACFNPPHTPTQVPPLALLSQETRDDLANDPDPDDAKLVYAAMLESVDTEIGNLLDQMDPAKLANTMIFVVADNGTPGHLIASPHNTTHGKGTVFQGGARVPMIVSGPLVPAAPTGGWLSAELVNQVDLWSTIEAITGADRVTAGLVSCTEDPIDSISFLATVQAPDQPTGARPMAFAQMFSPNFEAQDFCEPIYNVFGYTCLTVHHRSITDGEFKLHRRKTSYVCQTYTYTEDLYRVGPVGDTSADIEEANDLLDSSGNLLPNPPAGAAAALSALRAELEAMSGT